jgi:hypothetical protein
MEFHVGGTFRNPGVGGSDLATIVRIEDSRVYYKYLDEAALCDRTLQSFINRFGEGTFIEYKPPVPVEPQYDFQVGDTFYSEHSNCICTVLGITGDSIRFSRENQTEFVRSSSDSLKYFKSGNYHSYVSIKSNQSNANGTKNENQDKTRTSDTIGRAEKCGSAIASSIRGQIESGERYPGNKVQGKTVASRIDHVEISSCAISS